MVTGISVPSGFMFEATQEHFVRVVYKMNHGPVLVCCHTQCKVKSDTDDK